MEFSVLGPLLVRSEAGGRPLDIGGPRQRRLLARLLIGGSSVVSAVELVDAVWPESDRPLGADGSLRTYVFRLRKVFDRVDGGGDTLLTVPPGYRLDVSGHGLDSDRLAELAARVRRALADGEPTAAVEHAEEARRLWRGRPYAEVADEPWAMGEVRRLGELRMSLEEDRFEALLALGRHREVVSELEQRSFDNPERDRLCGLLMVAQYRAGRQADALRAYQAHRRRLGELTGLEPGAELRELEARIASGDELLLASQTGDTHLRSYRLSERIGEGSFAVVWRGLQPSLAREVAVKQIRAELANLPEFVHRFEVEAQLVARLEHPHVVPLYDYWREPGSAYLVMRWLRGGSLEARVADKPLSMAECGQLVSHVGGALAYAHRAGVVHRDVKSANVLCDDDGNFFLGDFGIAIDVAGAAGPEDSLSAGSPAYASPEQLRRLPVGPPADIYGLGVVVYEALTGRLPFPGERTRAGLLQRQLHDPIPLVGAVRPAVPGAVDEVLQRATAKNPQDRFGAVAEFVDALLSALPPAPGQLDSHRRLAISTMVSGARANPYKGLRSFGEADAADFAGRSRLINRLVAHLNQPDAAGRFLAVVGPSGSGKSSLVRAGLLPAVRSGRVGGGAPLYVTAMVPGVDPFEELESALGRIATDGQRRWAEALVADEGGIARAVKGVLPDEGAELLVVIDQFEELFILCDDEAQRGRFLRALCVAVTDPRSRLRVVLTLRADFWDRPLRYPELAGRLDGGAVVVGPLAPDELERAIVEPAARAGCEFEPGLVSAIVADVSDQPGALPMLQYALTELFERQVSGMLTMEAYRKLGGVAGALAGRAEELFAAAPAEEQAATRRLFTRLVALGEGVADSRRRMARSELGNDPATEPVIERYGRARLLSFDRDPLTREPTVEVAHEALIREWPRLGEWMNDDRDGLRVHRHLTDAARAWDQRGRDPGELYRGNRLDAALEWTERRPGDANEVESAFLAASAGRRDAEARALRRTNRRLRGLLAAVGAALVLALLAGGIAGRQQRRASRNADRVTAALGASQRNEAAANDATRQADVQRLVAQSKAAAPTNRQLALLLAVEADRLRPGADTEAAILNGLLAEPRFVGRLPGSDGSAALQVQPDGTVVAVDRETNAVRRWSLQTRQPIGIPWTPRVTGHFQRLASTVSIAGERVAFGGTSGVEVDDVATGVPAGPPIDVTASFNEWTPVLLSHDAATVYVGGGTGSAAGTGVGSVMGYDVATGTPSGVNLTGCTARVRNLALSPHGDLVAGGCYDATVVVWELGSGRQIARLPHRTTQVSGVFWSGDGNYLVSVGVGGPSETVLWSTTDWHDIAHYPLQQGSIGTKAAFAPDGTRVAIIEGTGTVFEVALPAGDVVGSRIDTQALGGDIAYNPDGSLILSAGDKGVLLWAQAGQQSVGRIIGGPTPSGGAWSPDGKQVAFFTSDRTVRLASAISGAATGPDWTIPDPDLFHAAASAALTFSPDGALLAVPGGGGSVQLYDTATRQPVGPTIRDPSLGQVGSVGFSPDGQHLAIGGGGRAAILDRSTGQRVQSIELSGNRNFFVFARWQGDQRLLLWEFSRRLVLVDAATGNKIVEQPSSASIEAVSLDGSLVALGLGDGTVELRSGKDLTRIGEPIPVAANNLILMSISPDNSRLIAGNDLGAARLIDLTNRTVGETAFPSPIARLSYPGGLAISPNGKEVLAARAEGGLVIWSIDPELWRRRACDLLGRNLTRAEWNRYLPNGGAYRKTCQQWQLDTT